MAAAAGHAVRAAQRLPAGALPLARPPQPPRAGSLLVPGAGRWASASVTAGVAHHNGGEEAAPGLAELATASQALRYYASQRHGLPLAEAAELLCRLRALQPSAHDERLRALVGDVVAQKDDLPLGRLVGVAQAVQAFGFQQELTSLTSLVMDSASFLPSDVVLSFARTLAISTRARGAAAGAGSQGARAAVFRILGEHVQEAMFDAAPSELAEALLALAVFYCSRSGGAPDPVLSRPRHREVFSTAAGLLLGGRAAEAPPGALVKCLRAYKLLLLGNPARPPAASTPPALGPGDSPAAGAEALQELPLRPSAPGVGGAAVELVPPALAEALAPRLHDLPVRDVVRSLHALTSLHARGVAPLDSRGEALCRAALQQLDLRADELSLRDLAFALRALSTLVSPAAPVGTAVTLAVSPELLLKLYGEVQHHIPALTLEDALTIARAADKMSGIARPGEVVELLAAEVLRELRNLRPQHVCDAVATFGNLRFQDAGFLRSMSYTFRSKLSEFLPRQVAVTLHSFARFGVQDHRIYTKAAPEVVRNIVGFQPRDMALAVWAFARAMHINRPLFTKVQEDLKRQGMSRTTPADISMLLWSFARVDWDIDQELLSTFANRIARATSTFPRVALLVTCLAFTRLGFAQQPILVELYRSLYSRLPELSDPQLAFSYFLYSTSGVRDEPLLRRFVFESAQRLPRLHGQDLSNVLLACSRTLTPASLAQMDDLGSSLRERVFGQLRRLGPAPLLGVFLAAPQVFSVSHEESLQIMDAMAPHLPNLGATELARCLLATARVEVVHEPFLMPLFQQLRQRRGQLSAPDVVSCIWSVHMLGFCAPKFRRTLGFVLLRHVKARKVAARTFRDLLPALVQLGFWERLPNSLRRSVWRLASDELRRGVSPPPSPRLKAAQGGEAAKPKPWRLPAIESIRQRCRRDRRADQQSGAEVPKGRHEQELRERQEERELAEERPPTDGRTAVSDFISLVRRL